MCLTMRAARNCADNLLPLTHELRIINSLPLVLANRSLLKAPQLESTEPTEVISHSHIEHLLIIFFYNEHLRSKHSL